MTTRRPRSSLCTTLQAALLRLVELHGSLLLSDAFEMFGRLHFSPSEIRGAVDRLIRNQKVEAVPHVRADCWPIPPAVDVELRKLGIRMSDPEEGGR